MIQSKKRFRKCRYCKEKTVPYGSMQPFCFKNECILEHNRITKEKSRRKAIKTLNESSKAWVRKQTKKACHAYIRCRDQHKPCISCGTFYNQFNYMQAGHFKNDGNHANVRYHEDNIAGQCVRCNMHKSGEEKAFETELRKRIGDERVEHILTTASIVKSYTIDELKQITEEYKEKIKQLNLV